MNEHEIENLLLGLTPAAPSTRLGREVDRELEQDLSWARQDARGRSGRVMRWLTPVMWSGLGAAAAVAVMLVAGGPGAGVEGSGPTLAATAPAGVVLPAGGASQAQQTFPSVLPVTTIREVVGAQDQGIQYNAQSLLPEQHVKLVSMERHAWIDPRDGASITVEMPREESVVLPVSFQ